MPLFRFPLLLFLGMSIVTQACEPASFDFQRFFRDHDSNKDGFLQKSELLTATEKQGDYGGTLTDPVTTENAFFTLDSDRDNKLSLDELWEWVRHHGPKCPEGTS